MLKIAGFGVKDKVIIHCKTAGFILDVPTQKFEYTTSVNVPKEKIKGTVGAGDAFCAGCLYALYNGLNDTEVLKIASLTAASNLFSENSVDGILPISETLILEKKYGRLSL